jgi:uncharacterized YigZ family protein
MSGFLTLSGEAEHREDISKSVFLAFARRADDPAEALDFLHALARRYPDASHLCWAYKIDGQYRFSDAGEPSGTAGQPILRAIEGQKLDHVVVGVIRYFGGVKLGAAGLTRAYGGVSAAMLRQAEKRVETPFKTFSVEVPFEFTGALYHLLGSLGAEKSAESFSASGACVTARVSQENLPRLRAQLGEATRGQFRLEVRE